MQEHATGTDKWIWSSDRIGLSGIPAMVKTISLYMHKNIFCIRGSETMVAFYDLTEGINLLLCVVIFILGYLVYRKQEKISALLISIAFCLFGLSHLDVLGGITFPAITFILLRICGYILVVAALYLVLSE
jgi:hypothetical protein